MGTKRGLEDYHKKECQKYFWLKKCHDVQQPFTILRYQATLTSKDDMITENGAEN